MRGRVAEVNVQGHLPYLRLLLDTLGLWTVLAELKLDLVTFPDLNLPRGLDDRALWNRCQLDGWVLFTENRNHDGPDLTLANKGRFEHSRAYAERVATDVAELLFGIVHGEYRDQDRIY